MTNNNEIEELKKELSQKNEIIKMYEKMQQEEESDNDELKKILNSKSWKITSPLRKMSSFAQKMKKNLKYSTVKVFRGAYKYFPMKLSTKQKILDKLTNKISFVKKIRYSQYNREEPIVLKTYCQTYKFGDSIDFIDKKIAVHVHMYYIDLLDEFFNYLNNIPYNFDVFVSVPKDDFIAKIEDKFNKLKNVKNVCVEKCENVGRDFSPMFVQFGNRIQNYDYVCHIHTKKSVRTGTEQDGWRNHLIYSVLGDEKIIKNIFYHFEDDEQIGMIYPETYKDIPYWAHTVLNNSEEINKLSKKFNISIDSKYFDYSAGSVFWAKTKSLKKIFDLKLKYKDFGTEVGKNDGTLAHAIERILPHVAMSSGYKYLVIDINDKVFRTVGNKNLNQYCMQNKKTILNRFNKFDTITFDIFDTLITRKVYTPSNIFELIEENENVLNFKQNRLNAEYNARLKRNFKQDVSIDDIYDELLLIMNCSKKEKERIKNLEIDYEIKYCIPRKEMLEIYNYLKQKGKKIILISDMYLKTDTVTKMLNKCGYDNFDELIISCEVNKRKDDGTMWDYYFKRNIKSIHCGDNETSDIQMVCDRKQDYYHVMQGKTIYELTNYGNFLNFDNSKLTGADKIILGCIINNKMFNCPFRKDFSKVVYNYKDYGYCFLAPLFLKYFLWLNEVTLKNKNDKLLFLAREGYFFEKMYEEFCKIKKVKPISHDYFLASRRSVSVAAINDMNDVGELLDRYYDGGLVNLFKSRFGYSIDMDDIKIELPRDKKKVIDIFESIKDDYFKTISKEKEEYKKYAKGIISNYKNIAVVDLGYSGTIQYYLSKLMDYKFDGYYFITDKNVYPTKIGCNVDSCFDSNNKDGYEDKILLYSLILESYLTAPYGQLINFSNGEANYKNDILTKERLDVLNEIFDGIIEFMNDIISLLPDISSSDISNEVISKNFASLILVDDMLPEDIENEFYLEDEYCSDDSLNIFSLLKSRR